MHKAGRQYLLVEGFSDRRGVNFGLTRDITIRICMEDFEQRIEIVGRLIYMEHRNSAVRTDTLPQALDCGLYGDHRILALR
jgi:hypothetical protein